MAESVRLTFTGSSLYAALDRKASHAIACDEAFAGNVSQVWLLQAC